MSKIGRPRKYRDKEHRERAEYMRAWYQANKELLMERLREDRKNNPEKYRARDRERYEKHKAKRSKLARKWARQNPDKARAAKLLWEKRNKEKKLAQSLVGSAIRCKRLFKMPCEVCGTSKYIQAHHDDYAKPLNVRWLCRTHHSEHHKRQRELEREMETKE